MSGHIGHGPYEPKAPKAPKETKLKQAYKDKKDPKKEGAPTGTKAVPGVAPKKKAAAKKKAK
jgi:hypothetical protein